MSKDTLDAHPKNAQGRCGQEAHRQHSNTALEEILKQGHCRNVQLNLHPRAQQRPRTGGRWLVFTFTSDATGFPALRPQALPLLCTTAHNFPGPRATLPACPAASIPSEFCNTQLNQNGVWHSGHGKGRRTASPNTAECRSRGDPSPPQSRSLGSDSPPHTQHTPSSPSR